jgi:hypothetical protein
MNRLHRALLNICIVALIVFGLSCLSSMATLKHKKETGKKCTYCHTGIPEEGDPDPQLNKVGKKFKENGYKLTEEQKKPPQR